MKKSVLTTAKECAYVAVLTALLIALQWVLSALPNVEVVTALFICYAFVFGVRRSLACAVSFSLLRQFVFGFFPKVLVLYLVFYCSLAVIFGLLGKARLSLTKRFLLVVVLACVCTFAFTLLDNVLTTVWYGYSKKASEMYVSASVPFMITHAIGNMVGISILFLPLERVFTRIKARL